jgi:hypothetical protein
MDRVLDIYLGVLLILSLIWIGIVMPYMLCWMLKEMYMSIRDSIYLWNWKRKRRYDNRAGRTRR